MDNVMLEAASKSMAEMLTPAQAPSRGVSLNGDPDPRQDAIHLNTAFKGRGQNMPEIINILAHRDVTQRAQIQQEYQAMYSEDLKQRLSQELGFAGDVSENLGVNISGGLNGELFGPLSSNIKLLIACLNAERDEGTVANQSLVEEDAKKLYKDGEGKWGTDEKTFIRIFTQRNRVHLAAVASVYHRLYGNSLAKAVKKETSGNFMFGLLTLLRCAENPAKYFAKVLYKAMKGLGTSDTTLIRVMVTRAEIDMNYIKDEYAKIHGKSLRDAIQSDTSGDYRTFLVYLSGPIDAP
ncbi:annexin D5-like isoform X2 [Magnolia sinica]|uniref:annexin D5-like isoform X2 n=1 Tax=Magnolia sinica TaxID=86752 RepID=UPI0026581AAB|nr:annexin D5-like isoform X2 [Magnolia sinica]